MRKKTGVPENPSGTGPFRSLPSVPVLGAGTGQETADLRCAFHVLVRPYDGGPEFIRFPHHGRIGNNDPLAVQPHPIVGAFSIPIDVFNADAVRERTT